MVCGNHLAASGAAFSKVVPGGSAAAAALQARMLAQAGVAPAAIGTELTAGALLLLGALAGLPLLTLPAVLLGRHIPEGLLQAGAIGLAVFVVLFAIGALLFANDRVLRAIVRTARAANRKLRPRHAPSDELPERLLAISRAGGPSIDSGSRAAAPIGLGEAIATSGGSMPCRWVVHAATMELGGPTSADIIRRATASTLRVADELGARSLALVAFGTGVGGFPVDEAARVEVEEVRRHLDSGSGLERVVFAVHGAAAREAFERAVGE